jgi:Centromere-binding protein ParB C-terminal
MSDAASNRTITGLGAPRRRVGGVRADASRLIASNRAAQPDPAAAAQPRPSPRAAKEQLNVAIPVDVRARIRAAYRYTGVTEGHRTFSDLITSLLEAEARRLEGQYNDGRTFTGGDQPLPGGRPLGE